MPPRCLRPSALTRQSRGLGGGQQYCCCQRQVAWAGGSKLETKPPSPEGLARWERGAAGLGALGDRKAVFPLVLIGLCGSDGRPDSPSGSSLAQGSCPRTTSEAIARRQAAVPSPTDISGWCWPGRARTTEPGMARKPQGPRRRASSRLQGGSTRLGEPGILDRVPSSHLWLQGHLRRQFPQGPDDRRSVCQVRLIGNVSPVVTPLPSGNKACETQLPCFPFSKDSLSDC